MEPEGSSPRSQEPATCSTRSQVHPTYPTSQPIPLGSIMRLFSHLLLGLPASFPTKTIYAHLLSAVLAAPTAHLILCAQRLKNRWYMHYMYFRHQIVLL
jgi:hypothetical protein